MSDDLPPITDDVPENELEAEPDHRALDDEGNPAEVDDGEA